MWLLVKVQTRTSAWFARFQHGDGRLTGVFPTPDPDHFVAVASGQGYWVSAVSPDVYELLPAYPIQDVLEVRPAGLVLFLDHTDIVAYNSSGKAWETGPVSSDGLWIGSADVGSIRGEAWDAARGCKVPFAVDTRTGRVTGGRGTD
jgi:hypothetical protein